VCVEIAIVSARVVRSLARASRPNPSVIPSFFHSFHSFIHVASSRVARRSFRPPPRAFDASIETVPSHRRRARAVVRAFAPSIDERRRLLARDGRLSSSRESSIDDDWRVMDDRRRVVNRQSTTTGA